MMAGKNQAALAVCAQTKVIFPFNVNILNINRVPINRLMDILTQRAYTGNGEKSCFVLQQIHWAETRDVI